MKKLMLIAFAMITTGIANAQVADQINQSRDRSAKLEVLVKDYKTCGVASIDGYGNDIKNAALLAVANSEQLENFYKREIGQTVDGVQDVTVKKPTLEEWLSLAATVYAEGASIKAAAEKLQSVADEAKMMATKAKEEKNPMKVAKEAKKVKLAMAVVEFGNAATPILIEESAAQVKAIDEIIKTLKAGKNL